MAKKADHSKARRIAIRIVVFVGILLALIVVATPMVGMPPPPEGGGGLGLRPDASEGKDGERKEQRSGGAASSELEFRNRYDTGGARVPVAVVLFHDDYSPPSGVYYFRQGAFSQYNGRKLVVSGRSDVDRDLIPFFPARPLRIEDAPPMNENRGPLETTIALMADHMQPFALEAPVEVEPMDNPSPNRFRRVYRATSGVLTADYATLLDAPMGSPRWSKEQWAHYTEAPPDARYAKLASEIVNRLPPDLQTNGVAKAFAITSWLSKEGIYSLKNEHSGSEDPTASFLFGDLTGYCVHFSHAAAYLMRSAGVPAPRSCFRARHLMPGLRCSWMASAGWCSTCTRNAPSIHRSNRWTPISRGSSESWHGAPPQFPCRPRTCRGSRNWCAT